MLYGLLTLPKIEKVNDRQGPFLCQLIANETIYKTSKTCGKNNNCVSLQKREAFAVVIQNASMEDDRYKQYPASFPQGNVKVRRECFEYEGGIGCSETSVNWVTDAKRPCYYRPHDKPVFWKNKKLTKKQETDFIGYLSLLLIFIILSVAVVFVLQCVAHPRVYSDFLFLWVPEPWRWVSYTFKFRAGHSPSDAQITPNVELKTNTHEDDKI